MLGGRSRAGARKLGATRGRLAACVTNPAGRPNGYRRFGNPTHRHIAKVAAISIHLPISADLNSEQLVQRVAVSRQPGRTSWPAWKHHLHAANHALQRTEHAPSGFRANAQPRRSTLPAGPCAHPAEFLDRKGPSKNYRIGMCRLLDGAPSCFLVRATICQDDIRSSSSCLPARPVHLHGRRFRCFEIGHRRTGRVRYLALSARGGRMVGPVDARGCWSGAGFRSHNLPRVLQDRRGLLALARMTERSRPVWG